MQDVMSPKYSPKALLPGAKSVKVKQVNPRVITIVGLIIGFALAILLFAIANRGKASGNLAQTYTPNKMQGESALPPVLGKNKPSDNLGMRPEVADQAKSFRQIQEKHTDDENRPFQQELRRWHEQQLIAQLNREQQAFVSEMNTGAGGQGSQNSAAEDEIGPQAIRLTSTSPNSILEGQADTTATIDTNLQRRKEAFAQSEVMSDHYLPYRKEKPRSPYEIKQGSVIPGVMITGINSDLPGQIIGQVSQHVYDTVSGDNLLIPQGSKIVGSYDSFIALGQERAMVIWRRLIFPDGNAIDLINMSGADQAGYAGFQDQVNNHYMKIFGSAILLSLVGAGYQISQPASGSGETPRDILAAEVGRQLSTVSGELIRRNMNIQPTIEIRPGYRFNIMVNKDIILEPYQEGAQ